MDLEQHFNVMIMPVNVNTLRSDVENTMFTELGQSGTIRNVTQSLDAEFGTAEGDPSNADTAETIVVTKMKDFKQRQAYGEFDPKRLVGYFKYNSVIVDDSIVIDEAGNQYEIESLYDNNVRGNIIFKKATLFMNNSS